MLRGVLAIGLWLAVFGIAQADPPGILESYGTLQQGPRIKAEKQTDSAAQPRSQSTQHQDGTKPSADARSDNGHREAEANSHEGANQGTEPQAAGLERADIYTMHFIFTNYGRTPAFVTRIGYNFTVAAEVPQIPEYRFVDGLTVEVVIGPDKPFEFDIPDVLMDIKPEQKKDFADGKVFAWLWGQIQFRDFLGGIGETGFIAFRYPEERVGEIVFAPAAFRFRGPAAYTYQRYTQGDDSDALRK